MSDMIICFYSIFKSRLHMKFVLIEQHGRALLLLGFFPHLMRLHMKLPTVIQGSLPRSPYTIQIKLVRKENNDKQKGMNSTLLVLTTRFCNCGIAKKVKSLDNVSKNDKKKHQVHHQKLCSSSFFLVYINAFLCSNLVYGQYLQSCCIHLMDRMYFIKYL